MTPTKYHFLHALNWHGFPINNEHVNVCDCVCGVYMGRNKIWPCFEVIIILMWSVVLHFYGMISFLVCLNIGKGRICLMAYAKQMVLICAIYCLHATCLALLYLGMKQSSWMFTRIHTNVCTAAEVNTCDVEWMLCAELSTMNAGLFVYLFVGSTSLPVAKCSIS